MENKGPLGTLSFREFAERMKSKGVKLHCEVCGGGEGWTLFSESEAGDMIEMMMLSYDKSTINHLAADSVHAFRTDFMKQNPFFAVMCRKCGHTKFFHKYTMMGDHGQ